MIGTSVLALITDSFTSSAWNLVLTGIGGFIGWIFYELVDWLKMSVKFYIEHVESHKHRDAQIDDMAKNIIRIENESKEQYEELLQKISELSGKMDALTRSK